MAKKMPETAEELYSMIQSHETRPSQYDNPWIRTEAEVKGGSTAYGPLQITKDRMKDLKRHAKTKEEKAAVDRILAEQKKMSKYGANKNYPESEKFRDDPKYAQYQYGASPPVSVEDQKVYNKLALREMQSFLADHPDGYDYDDVFDFWHRENPNASEAKNAENRKKYEAGLKKWDGSTAKSLESYKEPESEGYSDPDVEIPDSPGGWPTQEDADREAQAVEDDFMRNKPAPDYSDAELTGPTQPSKFDKIRSILEGKEDVQMDPRDVELEDIAAKKRREADTQEEVRVAQGDTLSKLAEEHGTTVEDLAKLNDIKDVNKIKAGQTLKLPSMPTFKGAEPAPLSDSLKKMKGTKEEPVPEMPSADFDPYLGREMTERMRQRNKSDSLDKYADEIDTDDWRTWKPVNVLGPN